jgi:hypothetical protein
MLITAIMVIVVAALCVEVCVTLTRTDNDV